MSILWDGRCYACGFIGSHGPVHRRQHLLHQVKKVEAFKQEHGFKQTTRQIHDGTWKPVTWNQLCEEVLACYRTMLEPS